MQCSDFRANLVMLLFNGIVMTSWNSDLSLQAHRINVEAHGWGSESLYLDAQVCERRLRPRDRSPHTLDGCFRVLQPFIHEAHHFRLVDDILQIGLLYGIVYLLQEGHDGRWEQARRRASRAWSLPLKYLAVPDRHRDRSGIGQFHGRHIDCG